MNAITIESELKEAAINLKGKKFILIEDGRIFEQVKKKRVPQRTFTTKDGYNVTNGYYLHDLVYTAFNGPIPKGFTVIHNNYNRHDNHIDNLVAVPANRIVETDKLAVFYHDELVDYYDNLQEIAEMLVKKKPQHEVFSVRKHLEKILNNEAYHSEGLFEGLRIYKKKELI